MNRGGRIMATIASHLSVDVLRARHVSSSNAGEARHFHVIWLLAKDHTIGRVAQMTSFAERWIEQLAARYNAKGPDALGDLRRRNGAQATILKQEVLEKLRLRLKDAPDDGGLWTSGKVAAVLARELGLEKVAVQRGWGALKALDRSNQRPRPRNPKSATPEEAAPFKKTSKTPPPRKPRNIPSVRSKSSPATNTDLV
jgi:transposase